MSNTTLTLTPVTLVAAGTSKAAAGTTRGVADMRGKLGGLLTMKIANGATGPTVGCDFVVYVGESTGTKREFSRQTAPTTNNAVTEFVVEVPPSAMFVNCTFTGNTAQAVTVEAYAQELTTVG